MAAEGGQLHYIEEGKGDPIVFVHGNPDWSYIYRNVVNELRRDHRCIAYDHIGFGLSDKPAEHALTYAAHARNLTRLLDHLGLDGVTLVAHDAGGPIATAVAEDQPQRIKRLVFMNSWLWCAKEDDDHHRAARLAASPLGPWLYTRWNYPARQLRPLLKSPECFNAYAGPLNLPNGRLAPLELAKESLENQRWFEDLWAGREALEERPVLLLWGLKGGEGPTRMLNRLWAGFPLAQVETFAESGRRLPEERPDAIARHVRNFVARRETGPFLG